MSKQKPGGKVDRAARRANARLAAAKKPAHGAPVTAGTQATTTTIGRPSASRSPTGPASATSGS